MPAPSMFVRLHPVRKVVGLAMILAIPGVAFAGQVKGKLVGLEKLMNPVWNEAKEVSSHRFSWREPSPTVRAEFRNLFAYAPKEVCIAAIGSSPQSPPNLPLLITIGGGRTTPVTVVVVPGTRLHFENRDPFPHKIYAVGQPSFPPGEIKPLIGGRDWMAPGPGKYEIRDEMSPSVRSWIVVEPNVAAIAYPTSQGAFLLPQLGNGEYTLKAFFAGNPVGTPKSFQLGTTNLDLTMPVAEANDKRAEAAEKKADATEKKAEANDKKPEASQ